MLKKIRNLIFGSQDGPQAVSYVWGTSRWAEDLKVVTGSVSLNRVTLYMGWSLAAQHRTEIRRDTSSTYLIILDENTRLLYRDVDNILLAIVYSQENVVEAIFKVLFIDDEDGRIVYEGQPIADSTMARYLFDFHTGHYTQIDPETHRTYLFKMDYNTSHDEDVQARARLVYTDYDKEPK